MIAALFLHSYIVVLWLRATKQNPALMFTVKPWARLILDTLTDLLFLIHLPFTVTYLLWRHLP